MTLIIRRTNGYGLWRTQMLSVFVVCIIFLLFSPLRSYQTLLLLSGIRMFLLRSCCLLGACFGIDCLQRTIYSGEVLFTLIPGCVWQGAALSKRLIIYLFIVIFLVLFGTQFIVGLASQWPTHFMCLIIFISSAFVVVLGRGGAPFYSLFGLQRCGKYGRKETIDCSKAKNAPFSGGW